MRTLNDLQVRTPWRIEMADAVQDFSLVAPDGRWLAAAEVSGTITLIAGADEAQSFSVGRDMPAALSGWRGLRTVAS